MDRRDFLRSATFGTATALLPPFLRRAFAAPSLDTCDPAASRSARDGLDLARRHGKPLLVFVAPESDDARGRRGALFGELIDLGPDRSLALLALAEVACAPLAVVRCLVPDAAFDAIPDDVVMLLVEPEAAAPRVQAIPVVVPSESELPVTKPYSPQAEAAFWRRVMRSDIATFTAALRRALAGPALGRRARINARSLPADDRRRIVAFVNDRDTALPIDVADAGAPFLLVSALTARNEESRQRTIARLAAVTRQRLQQRPPPGARWIRLAPGCVRYAVESPDDGGGGVGCGLGSVPVLSARFLDLQATAP